LGSIHPLGRYFFFGPSLQVVRGGLIRVSSPPICGGERLLVLLSVVPAALASPFSTVVWCLRRRNDRGDVRVWTSWGARDGAKQARSQPGPPPHCRATVLPGPLPELANFRETGKKLEVSRDGKRHPQGVREVMLGPGPGKKTTWKFLTFPLFFRAGARGWDDSTGPNPGSGVRINRRVRITVAD